MKRWFFFLMILTLSTATLAEAGPFPSEQKVDRWDFSIMTRYSWAQDITNDDGSAIKLDSDLGWGFGFSKYVKEQFKVGLMFAWHSTYYTGTVAPKDTAEDPFTYTNVLSTSAIALAGDYTFGTSQFKPYLSGNLGWMKANTNITSDVDSGCWYYPYVGEVCGAYESDTYGNDSFTYGLGLGLRIEMSPTAFLKIGYEHSWVDLESYDGNDILRVDLGFLI